MEDQDRETRIDEDVEGHVHKARNINKDEGDDVEGHVHKARNINKDEGDDVEGHVHKARNDEDDVEAHVHLNAVNKGVHKA